MNRFCDFYINIFGKTVLRIFFAVFFLSVSSAMIAPSAQAFHYPWDQGHDTTNPNDPNKPGPCEGPNCDPCKSSGSPVYVPTGHFIWSETDLSMAGRPGLSITRTYNSNDPRVGSFGNGWASDCDLRLLKNTKYLTDENGNTVKENQISLIAANGKRFTFKRDSGGVYTPPLGRTDTVTEMEAGALRLTSQGGYAHQFDSVGRLTQRTEPNGNSVNYAYDSSGRISQLSDNANRSIAFNYDANGLVSTLNDHTGRTWTYGYDDDGNLVSVTDPLGGVRTYTYIPFVAVGDGQTYYQLQKITDESGVVVTEVTYNNERVASYTVAENQYNYSYDVNNRRVTKTDRQNSRWIFEYNEDQVITKKTDPLNNVMQYQYDADGNLLKYTDALGKEWLAEFDDEKRKVSHTTPLGFKTEFEYATAFAQPTKVTTPTGREQTIQLDARGNAVQSTNGEGDAISMTWSADGDLTRLTDALGNASNMAYNTYGLVSSTVDPIGNTAAFTYDTLGRVAVLTSAEGKQLTTEYDALDRVTKIIDPSGNETSYRYDAAGRTLSLTDPAGKVTAYEYDSFGRLVKRTYPDNRTVNLEYRNDNLVSQIIRADSSVVQNSYDAAKLVTNTNVGGAVTSYTYSPRYELLSTTNAIGTITYTYDDDGRLVGENQGGQSLTYSYNAENERAGFALQGRQTSYVRDRTGRITTITTPEGAYNFTYDKNGKRTGHTLPNGSQVSYSYDASERLIGLSHQGQFTANYSYENSADDILIGVTADTGNWEYSYDDDSQLVAANNGGTSYPVDNAGNITSNGRTYDDNHRLIDSTDFAFEYDARGNLTRKTDKSTQAYTQYTWDTEDQLTKVERFADDQATVPSVTLEYTYGPLGRRWSKTANGVTERFIYNGDDLVATQDSIGAVTNSVTFGPAIDEPLSGSFSGARRYFHADHLGSIVALTDDSTTTDTYSYGPFGEANSVTGATDNPFRYTAREYEADDLYYYRNRYYDPTLQRFISEDRFGFAGGDHNLYRYAGNNPTNFTDPDGNWAFLIPIIWGGIELGLAAYDAYSTYQTLTDPCIGTWEKALELGLFAAGALLPGGGYSKADDAFRYGDDLADAARRNPCGCFDGETEVLTEDGYKKIKDVEQYEKVLAKNEETGEVGYKPVMELLRYEDREFHDLELVSSEGTITNYVVTDDHPFWVKGIGWVESDQLEQGMPVMDLQNDVHYVHILSSTGKIGVAYNFEVADFHTYFVGKENVWVHNCWKEPREWANLDHSTLRDRIRKEQAGFESGRHDQYPGAMRDALENLADKADARGDLPEYGERLREIAETYNRRARESHRGGRTGRGRR